MILVVGDTHLDDKPENEYRWDIFEHIRTAVMQYDVSAVFQLGDAVDRRDRFSAAFVNRLVTELRSIAARTSVVILRGNHDTTMKPPNYFEWLNTGKYGIRYIHEPTEYRDGVLLLPFSHAPKAEWSRFRLSSYLAIFMHATVTGAVTENGTVMENNHFPILPRAPKIYSGDIHVPQNIGNVIYIGAPYPIRFGDKYPCRMVLLDEHTFDIVLEIPLTPMRKRMIDVSTVVELQMLEVTRGDQVKIRFKCPAVSIGRWGEIEAGIAQWAAAKGVTVASIEAVVESTHVNGEADPEQSPEQILREFAAQEGLSAELLTVGLGLLTETQA